VSAFKDGPFFPEWDYLIVTAANDRQAEAYRNQIKLRESLGLIQGVSRIRVIADPGGRRVGSGGSTIHCLLQVLNLELAAGRRNGAQSDREGWAGIFGRLRILIVHAGGDSRRLPPYGPCGKIFVPVPGGSEGPLGTTVFDRLIPTYFRLPKPPSGGGQVVVASGDVLLDFDAASVKFAEKGVTGVGALVLPDLAKNHGVYCREEGGEVRLFLQKPSPVKQVRFGAVNAHGQTVLDIGILNFSPEAVIRLLELCDVGKSGKGRGPLRWRGTVAGAIESAGLDIYREFCCALGRDARREDYLRQVREAGSAVRADVLHALYRGLRPLPFRVHVVPRFRFLHFGTLRELIDSGRNLLDSETAEPARGPGIVINSTVRGSGMVSGKDAWIEGCRIDAPLKLAGDNVVVGLDIESPLALPRGGALDILEGKGRDGRHGWFVRAFETEDVFHLAADKGARLCGLALPEWLSVMGASRSDVWQGTRPAGGRTVWNGRFFPFVGDAREYREWLWLLEPKKASPSQKAMWLSAERHSLEDMAVRADLDAFYSRRLAIRGGLALESLSRCFGPEGELSAAEIAFFIGSAPVKERAAWIIAIVREAVRSYEAARLHRGLDSLGLSRILHTAGSVLLKIADGAAPDKKGGSGKEIARALGAGLTDTEKGSLRDLGTPVERASNRGVWAEDLKEAAFRHLGRTIVFRSGRMPAPPKSVLRSDEIVWGRAPARLDLGGGWTDTPPYSLERGGCVINAAVTLNGQAPIQAYARVIDRREVRINSIDHSERVVVRSLDELMDYRKPGSQFALAKAALALAGFATEAAAWPAGVRTLDGMLARFGGGIELTTLAAIPSGSGLGTSSIMGAVLMSVIGRMVGRPLSARDLFHAVLKLEQELTTGGGWQDQIGGAVEGVKMIEADKGLVPDPRIHFVPADLLDPAANGGRTLLYYTGIRRLAKNILHEVVGRYLDRDRAAMETLRRLHAFPPLMAEAMGMRDAARFGELIDIAWRLNVDLDPDHTTPVIENLREMVRPHVLGAKLLGAGGGGFLLMVCRSPEDAAMVRALLERKPPNDKARFFDYVISRTGLVVTVC
jgi:galactokinase/mevalonate kinase-like predicted kinase